MIDVKQAVQNATMFLTEMYAAQNIKDILLEEVRLAADDWVVTLSFSRTKPQLEPLLSITQSAGELERVYKTLTISKATGSVVSMRIAKNA